MGDVLQKARDAKAAYDEKKAQFKIGEKKSEFMTIKGVIAETTGAPVLGPGICLVFHRFTALFAVIFFLYTIADAVPTFYEKKSFASVEFQTVSHLLPRANSPNPASLPSAPASWSDRPVVAVQEFKLPDVYMCLPAHVVSEFTLKDTNNDKEWAACKADAKYDGDLSRAVAGCEFTMIRGHTVKGMYDVDGSSTTHLDSSEKVNPQGGATFQMSSSVRPEVPLYSIESLDLKTYEFVKDNPVADMSIGGAGYDCTEEYFKENAACKGYALASNTPCGHCCCPARATLCLLFPL